MLGETTIPCECGIEKPTEVGKSIMTVEYLSVAGYPRSVTPDRIPAKDELRFSWHYPQKAKYNSKNTRFIPIYFKGSVDMFFESTGL